MASSTPTGVPISVATMTMITVPSMALPRPRTWKLERSRVKKSALQGVRPACLLA
jgi:hypothetical protein